MTEIDLLQAVQQGPVLTVNRRLRAWLAEEYDRRMVQAGRQVWNRPEILPAGAWLMQQLQQADPDRRILTPVQHELLWQQIIAEDSRAQGAPLVGTVSCARLALEAQQLLGEYCCDIDSDWGSDDVRAFLRWRSIWQERVGKEGWHGPHQVGELVLKLLEQNRLAPPEAVTLAGFDTMTPVFERLLKVLEERGCRVCQLETPRGVSEPVVVSANDPDDEIGRCATWVRQVLDANPDVRIGIVVPRLEDYRAPLLHGLQAELAPASCLLPDSEAPVNISLGTSLADEGVVFLALTLFGLKHEVELGTVGLLLRSPFLTGGRTEAFLRAQLDRDLRGRAQRTDRWQRYARLLLRAGLPGIKKIVAALDRWLQTGGRHLPGSWAERMANLLEAVGWPGEQSPDRRTWQAVQHLLELLQTFASLDRLGVSMSRSEAAAHLARMARDTEFQVDRTESRVQVLGLLESTGLQFDYVWMMGLTDQVFPAAAAPNPFLPLQLQRQKGMPHADADREFLFAQRVWQRLRQAASGLVCSWPATVEGAECRPSPFLQGLPRAESPSGADSVRPHGIISRHACLIRSDDSVGNPLPAGRPFSGGTAILKDQALCPFRAYLHQRLRAEQLDEADIGIDAKGRGNLVHLLVQYLWQRLHSRKKLSEISPDALDALLAEAAGNAVAGWQRREEIDLPARQQQVEKERLVRIGRTWLDKELERSDFEVHEVEQLREVHIGDLVLRVRVDRIDRLADGRFLVIDYKTGRPDIAPWFDERVTEPQLPLYSLQIPEDHFAGAFFARVHCRRQECGYLGVSRPENAWDERRYRLQAARMADAGLRDMEELLRHWQQNLEQLAQEFARGHAAVSPVDPEKACKYCDGLPVCRLLEKRMYIA